LTTKTEERCETSPAFADLIDKPTYRRLLSRAASLLRREGPGHPFEPADLVHETFLRIARSAVPVRFHHTNHLVALAAIVMRRVLIDLARDVTSRRSVHTPLDPEGWATVESFADTLCLRDALARLANYEDRLFRVVEMRIFKGFDVNEIASALDVSSRTVKRDWRAAQKWLRDLFAAVPSGRQLQLRIQSSRARIAVGSFRNRGGPVQSAGPRWPD
jgi:RNA polymerase sigma-70 factor, ECF subfamily